MYCPNCKQEYDGKFCPECGTKLIEKPLSGGLGLNFGDAAAISGGVSMTDSHAVHSEDHSVHNTSSNTSTVNNITQVFHVYGQAGAEMVGSISPEKKKINLNSWLLLTGDIIDCVELDSFWDDRNNPDFTDIEIEEATHEAIKKAFIQLRKNDINAITLLSPTEPVALGYVAEGNSLFIIIRDEDEYRFNNSLGIGYIKQIFSDYFESDTLPDFSSWHYLRFSNLV